MAQKITPFLWFDNQAEEAARFYTSVFNNSKINEIRYYGSDSPFPEGTALSISFELEGQSYLAFNGGPVYHFTPAISLMVDCKTQAEVDALWDKLTEDGEEVQCGWLTDKYGVSWQIIPSALSDYLGGDDPEGAMRATQAMLQMKKIDIEAIKQAYEGN